MTPAINNSIIALRALLTDDTETFCRLHRQHDEDERRAFAALLTAAFYKAATDRFGVGSSASEVIEFVADARARRVGPDTVSADDAERVLRAVLDEDELIETMDACSFGAAQTAMLIALMHGENVSEADIEALLAAAEEQATSFFERHSSQ